jgi:glucose-6-phosphate 1-epimerase
LGSQESFAELNKSHGISGVASIVSGNGGLAKVVVNTRRASGEMYLHGGHVTSWRPAGNAEVLYLSPNSLWQDGKAIRGGVPVCFPWFGDKAGDTSAPAHGFVRTRAWALKSVATQDGDAVVTMEIANSKDARQWWPHDFRLQCRARFGEELRIDLIVTNEGESAFSFEEALHAYFKVGDVQQVQLQGLDAISYLDKTDHRAQKTQYGELRLTRETDSIFLNTQGDIELDDPSLPRVLKIQKENSLTTVVWNPWAEKSAGMADLGAGEWKNFVCAEASNVLPCSAQIDPGKTHRMSLILSVQTQ